MDIHVILDRLERMHAKLADGKAPDDYRLYQVETMIDVLISHIKDTIRRESPPQPERRSA